MVRLLMLVTVAASMFALSAAAQAPAPTTTAFDGKYIGTATLSWGYPVCATITSADMTITGGQVVIHEIFFNGFRQTYYGSVNTAGEVSTQFEWKRYGAGLRTTIDTLNGTIHNQVFTGPNMHGRLCHWNVQMVPRSPSTMPFDGEYIGVSRESSKTAGPGDAECPSNRVPAPLTIWNGIVGSDEASWRRTVSPQGVLAMGNQRGRRVDGQIDSQGIIRGEDTSDVGCSSIWVWRKRAG